jgi:hypothetical protein
VSKKTALLIMPRQDLLATDHSSQSRCDFKKRLIITVSGIVSSQRGVAASTALSTSQPKLIRTSKMSHSGELAGPIRIGLVGS